MTPNISRKGDCWDNAPTERISCSLKSERPVSCCLPSVEQRRLFLPVSRKFILKTMLIPISRLSTEPAPSLSPALDSRHRVCPRTSLPACRLHFGRVGLTLYDRFIPNARAKALQGINDLRPRTFLTLRQALQKVLKAITHWATISNFTGLRPIQTT